jgi:hypothetical protein
MNTHITLAGKTFPFKFGMAAMAKFEDQAGYSVGSVLAKGEQAPIKDIINLIFYGIKDGERIEMKNNPTYTPTEITWEDLADMIDADQEGFVKGMEKIAEGMTPVDQDPKKKGVRKR